MRTAIFIIAGCLAWGLCALGGRFVAASPRLMQILVILFVVFWLGVAVINLWFGVSHAGYSVSDELPIFLLIFAVPAAFAILVKWKWFGVGGG
jgi:hypothetical protein